MQIPYSKSPVRPVPRAMQNDAAKHKFESHLQSITYHMKIITYKSEHKINYPVGSYIQHNLPIIEKMANKLHHLYGKNDAQINLWCSGSSGAIIASLVAQKFENATILHVKKEQEASHSNNEFFISSYITVINIIVDDFVQTGSTINRIRMAMKNSRTGLNIDCIALGERVPEGSKTAMLLKTFNPDTVVCIND